MQFWTELTPYPMWPWARRVALAAAPLALAACASAVPARPGAAAPRGHAPLGAAGLGLPPAGRGRLAVAVRRVDDPDTPVAGAAVSVRPAPGVGPERGAPSGGDGTARIEAVPAGRYALAVRAIGYRAPAPLEVEIAPGCTVVVEVYLALAPFCLFECPQTAPRATVTTCPPAA
jgi:hypothetical protein